MPTCWTWLNSFPDRGIGLVKDYSATIDLSDKNSAHTKMIQLVGMNRRVIDLGCYTGAVAKVLKDRGCYVVGVELDSQAAAHARLVCDRVIEADLETVELGDFFADERFDVALFGDVIEHLKDPKRLLIGVRELLNPGGFIVVSVPNVAHASVRLALLRGEFDYEELGILDDTHLKYFTRKTISDLLESCGYIIDVMDWTERRISSEALRRTLDPLGLGNLDEVIKAFSSWEAIAYQYVIKAFPASEEEQVRRISEEKVQAEKRARELEKQLEDYERLIEDLKKMIEQSTLRESRLGEELAKAATYAEELEQKIDEKDEYIRALEKSISELRVTLEKSDEEKKNLEQRIAELSPTPGRLFGRLKKRD